MKLLRVFFAVSLGILQGGHASEAEDKMLLKREVLADWSCKTFDEALTLIGQRTGLKVVCPDGLVALHHGVEKQSADSKVRYISPVCLSIPYIIREAGLAKDGRPQTMPVEEFLRDVCWSQNLAWKVDAEKGTVTLYPIWKKSDPRTAAELLDFVLKLPDTRTSDTEQWQTAFDALLSKDSNYAKAVAPRQRTIFEMSTSTPILAQPITNTKKERYLFIMEEHHPSIMPGCSSISYYWFKRDGTLLGADIMTNLRSATLRNPIVVNDPEATAGAPSELQMVYRKSYDSGGYCIARFELGETGLKLTHLIDDHGKELSNGDDIGFSSMPPVE